MQIWLAFSSSHRFLLLELLVSFLIAIVFFDGGKGVVLLLGFLALVQAMFLMKTPRLRPIFSHTCRTIYPLSLSVFLLLAYFTLSLLWAETWWPSLAKAGQLFLLFINGFFCIVAAHSGLSLSFSLVARVLFKSYWLLLLFLSLEVLLRCCGYSLFHVWHPIRISEPFALITKSGLFTVLFFWPSAFYFLIIKQKWDGTLPSHRTLRWMGKLSIPVGALFCFGLFFHMDVILVALLASWGVFCVLLIFPRLVYALLGLGCLIPMSLPLWIKPLFIWSHASSYFFLMPASWQHRLYIWNFVTHRIWEKPIFGWGLEASRFMSHPPISLDFVDNHTVYSLHGTDVLLPLHPHNGFLQLWLEGGSLGVLLFSIFLGTVFLYGLRAFPLALHRAFLGASITSCLVPFCLSYGVWQSWWIMILFALALYWSALSKPHASQ